LLDTLFTLPVVYGLLNKDLQYQVCFVVLTIILIISIITRSTQF